MHTILQPEGWAKPIGYANGVAATGRTLFVGGQIGWNAQSEFETDDFVEQVRQTLKNVVAVLAAGGAEPHHITTMTWYFTDKQEYVGNLRGIGQAYREIIGRHFPAMAAMLNALLRRSAKKAKVSRSAWDTQSAVRKTIFLVPVCLSSSAARTTLASGAPSSASTTSVMFGLRLSALAARSTTDDARGAGPLLSSATKYAPCLSTCSTNSLGVSADC